MTQAGGWRLARYDTLPSTSDACVAQAEAGAAAGLAIQARAQTRARGSRGRTWSDAGEALALSVLLRPRRHGSIWPMIAGLALHDALCVTPEHAAALWLKWPNDIMLRGRKLAGILIDAAPAARAGGPDGGGWLVIGFGANLASAPDLAGREAACLAELGPRPPAADALADRLLAALWRRCLDQHNPDAIRRAWLARAHPPGTELAVQVGDVQTIGMFSTIAEDGALLLDVAGEIRRFATGEVLLPQGA